MRTRVTQIADWNNNLEPNPGMKSVLICYNHGVQWDCYQSKNLISFLALLHEVRRGFPYGLAGLAWCLAIHLMEFGLKFEALSLWCSWILVPVQQSTAVRRCVLECSWAMIAYTTRQSQQSSKKKRLLCTTASNGAIQTTSVWFRSTEIGEWWGRTWTNCPLFVGESHPRTRGSMGICEKTPIETLVSAKKESWSDPLFIAGNCAVEFLRSDFGGDDLIWRLGGRGHSVTQPMVCNTPH